jgi:predicted signal transduction protein with EAL and GGDEF domain
MIEWNFAIVAASVVDAVVVAIAGYWILFRLLLWKVSDAPHRSYHAYHYYSLAVIACHCSLSHAACVCVSVPFKTLLALAYR